jgi:hypothetical protein
MVLSDENVIAFQTLYKEQFGKDISKEEAYEQATKLLSLVSIVYRPMTAEAFERFKAQQAVFLREQN